MDEKDKIATRPPAEITPPAEAEKHDDARTYRESARTLRAARVLLGSTELTEGLDREKVDEAMRMLVRVAEKCDRLAGEDVVNVPPVDQGQLGDGQKRLKGDTE